MTSDEPSSSIALRRPYRLRMLLDEDTADTLLYLEHVTGHPRGALFREAVGRGLEAIYRFHLHGLAYPRSDANRPCARVIRVRLHEDTWRAVDYLAELVGEDRKDLCRDAFIIGITEVHHRRLRALARVRAGKASGPVQSQQQRGGPGLPRGSQPEDESPSAVLRDLLARVGELT